MITEGRLDSPVEESFPPFPHDPARDDLKNFEKRPEPFECSFVMGPVFYAWRGQIFARSAFAVCACDAGLPVLPICRAWRGPSETPAHLNAMQGHGGRHA